MSFFIVIGGSWLVIAGMLLWSVRRSEDPMTGDWRAHPSTFFGGPAADEAPAEPAPVPLASPARV